MIYRIEVGFKNGIKDALGEKVKKRIIEDLGIKIEKVNIIDVYTIEADLPLHQKFGGGGLSKKELKFLGEELFSDPVIQEFSVDKPLAKDFDSVRKKFSNGVNWLIEVGFKPGVTDNAAKTSKSAIEDVLRKKLDGKVYTSKKYLISQIGLKRKDLERIAKDLLANELIQRWLIIGSADIKKNIYLSVPEVKILHKPAIREIELNVSNKELLKISEERKLALNLEEMQKIRDYFSSSKVIKERQKFGLAEKPTDAELEALAQTWSEHCKHKIFNAKIIYKEGKRKREIDSLFKTYIKNSTERLKKELNWVVSTLWDNSGVMRFNKNWLFAFKGETHNSPSNEEPYGGAITGIVGVYRDPMGTGRGCRLIFGTYGFCTGSPYYNGVLKPKIHPKRLLEGVRKGVEDGGNKSGIPTIYGITFFDDGYIGKPAIYVLAAGLIPAKINGEPGELKKVKPGDLIVMAGGRVGIDGIHGATESSMEAGKWISAAHVQIGDPFTQKKLHDFLIEARDLKFFRAITDNGAGGLSSSVGELAQFSNGFELKLDKVPLKYTGLNPWQILVSESQERMTLAVSPKKINQFLKLAKKHDVEATVIGKFTNSGKFYSTYKGKPVTFLDMDFIHHGLPQMELKAEWLTPEKRGLAEPNLKEIGDKTRFLKEMLARDNIASKEYIVRQFDHEVQGGSVVKHLVGENSDVYNDAAVVKPLFDSNEGIAVAAGINPEYSKIDTYWMTALAIDEAVRRIIAVGGSLKQIALNDNFCWPSPLSATADGLGPSPLPAQIFAEQKFVAGEPSKNNPDARYKLAQLIRANQALYDFCLTFKTPCISGKDSMSMDGTIKKLGGSEERISALPTIQFSAAGKIEDVSKCVTMDVKEPGDLVYILGPTKDELGSSEYYEMFGEIGLKAPKVEVKTAIKLYNALSKAIAQGLIASAHGIYKGGLAVALAQISFAGGLGLEVDLNKVPIKSLRNPCRVDKILYSESASRFLVTVSPKNKKNFEEAVNPVRKSFSNRARGNIFREIGKVRDDEIFKITIGKKTIIKEDISKLKEAWQKTFKNF